MTVSLIGKRFGNYDIQAKLGEGGMGSVYLGLHPQIGKRVAIKVLHEELASKADVVARFFTEARSVNDINHPNIVDIVDFGETSFDGVVFKYIIMEFLDGESLAVRIRREGVSIRETLYIVMQAASALAASHQKGVIHRDLKPENIYLCSRGPDRNYVKLLDFGIAKLTGDGAAMTQKTRTGMVIGTPAYMSPEQCEGRGNIDHRSDIYAMGVVMYELLAGRVPFPGDGFGEVLVAHLTRDPEPPSRLNPNIPPEIEALVLHCLRKDRSQRFQTMLDLGNALNDPPGHYQQWLQTAQLPSGAVPAGAGMGTLLAGMQGTGAMAALPSGPHGVNSAGWPATGSAMLPLPPEVATVGASQMHMTGMRSPTGLGMVPADMLVAGSTRRPGPTTLSGSSGEAAGHGRRPRNVLIGFLGAIAIGILSMAGFRGLSRPIHPPDPIAQPQKPVRQMVTIRVNSTPAAEVIRSDEPEANPEKTPYEFKINKGTPSFDIKLRLDGYAEETRTINPGTDQQIDISLKKAEAPPTEAPAATIKPSHHRQNKDKLGKEKPSHGKRKGKTEDGDGVIAPIF